MYRRSLIGCAAAASLLPAAGRTQAFPSKQLRLLVGFAAGGGGDIVARILAQELTKSGGLSVMVDNKPGAGGNLATREMLRAPADGHTILLANVGVLAVNPYAMKDVGYDPRDIAPVCLAVDFSNVLVVHPSVPAKSLAEYLALAKPPDGMNYGTSGVGSAGHLAGELLKSRSGAQLNHVPFRGGGPAMNDLVAGHVPSLIASAPTATGFMREGRIRALAVTGAKRSPVLPEVPTMAEAGVGNVDVYSWQGIVGPKGLPADVRDKFHGAVVAALNDPQVKQQLTGLGLEIVGNTPAQFTAFQQQEFARWKRVIEVRKITAD